MISNSKKTQVIGFATSTVNNGLANGLATPDAAQKPGEGGCGGCGGCCCESPTLCCCIDLFCGDDN